MQRYDLDVLCLQETWKKESCVKFENGYMVSLSGSDAKERSWAGVGFVVAPRCTRAVQSFKQISDRLAGLKIRVRG